MDLKLILQIAGVLLGLLYLWLEYRADIRLWIVGLVMPLVHGTLYYKAGLYADSSMQVYYVLAGLYGWFVWHNARRKGVRSGSLPGADKASGSSPAPAAETAPAASTGTASDTSAGTASDTSAETASGAALHTAPAITAETTPGAAQETAAVPASQTASGAPAETASAIGHTPWRLTPALIGVYAVAHAAIYLLLVRFTNSSVPFWDAGTTAASIVAMWMLSRKYVEQWLVWLAVDVVTVGLYLYKGIPLTAALYALYSALAVAGYLRWRRQAAQAR